MADKARVESVHPLLEETVDELKVSYARRADAQDLIEHTRANISFMKDQLALLQQRLAAKRKEAEELEESREELLQTIQSGAAMKSGLCIRSVHCLRTRRCIHCAHDMDMDMDLYSLTSIIDVYMLICIRSCACVTAIGL